MPEDDRPEIPDADVDREFGKAERMLADARKARGVDISTATIVNRLYYACFHAVQAALYAHDYNPQSHGRVQTLLGSELIEAGKLPRERGRFFNDMGTYRRRVDYGSGGIERDVDDLIEETAVFLDDVRELLEAD